MISENSLKLRTGFSIVSEGTDRTMTEHIMGNNDATKAPIPLIGFRWDRTLMNSARVALHGGIPDGDVHHYAASRSYLVI